MQSSRKWIGRPRAGEELQKLGQRVRALRLARGLSQNELAQPYSRAFVSLLEAGGIAPSPRAIETLAARLGIDPEALIGGEGPCEMSS
jgi:transcriptional regulator with XRE-family HTH domain